MAFYKYVTAINKVNTIKPQLEWLIAIWQSRNHHVMSRHGFIDGLLYVKYVIAIYNKTTYFEVRQYMTYFDL